MKTILAEPFSNVAPGISATPRRHLARTELQHRTSCGLVTHVVVNSGRQGTASKVLHEKRERENVKLFRVSRAGQSSIQDAATTGTTQVST